ncbi:transcriptional regulator [Anoxybacillus flavithermus]|uniref:Transcriptional regulator n=1 Tax=Anoxybacillus flavithermus TaxID=33934 RepID=A0A2G5RRL2_9BACL|nr:MULTISPECIES: helix-turn-helix domain-containing protein [Anoxybacillus]KFZ42701.1 transcriptional regulator [Anoxybacillus sp. KU2-6(11)]PIC05301.1 transcriptional regulator [Anoxybacillus flavithermus]
MLEKLQAYYRDALVEYGQVNERDAYEWFSTEHGELFGIKKEMLTQKERALLATLFTPYEAVTTWMNKQQQAWYRFLIQNDKQAFEQLPSSTYTRFIYFYIQKGTVDSHDFMEAIQSLFPYDVTIISETEQCFIVIEQQEENVASTLSELIDTLCSDFYIQLRTYIGQKCPHTVELAHMFLAEKRYFQVAITHKPEQRVYCIEDVFPLLLINNEDITYAMTFLQPIKQDPDIVKTMKTFFECNLNVSLAAKKLHMHRNSLQYRIDKLIEKTGIDIKQFKGALTVYLAILLYERH